MKWKWFNWICERAKLWFSPKYTQNRPHFVSKNAWSYRSKGKLTAAQMLYLKLGAM